MNPVAGFEDNQHDPISRSVKLILNLQPTTDEND